MVSTEYPPITGGVGRYTEKLTKSLRKLGIDVYVACNDAGKGDFSGLSPQNDQNSQVLLKIVDNIKPDLVHIQYEPGMYGASKNPKNLRSSGETYIDLFYKRCPAPIVTTYHTAFTLKQWLSQAELIKKSGKTKQLGIPPRFLIRLFKYSLIYRAFQNQNKEKLALSKGGIVFSQYASKLIGGGAKVIYHGAEPALATTPSKTEARKSFSLPGGEEGGGGGEGEHTRIALALGYKTSNKGWDILGKIRLPQGWKIVINSSKSHYNTESYRMDEMLRTNKSIIDIQRGFLSEEELSALFYSADAVLLPYKVTAGSGVMFDALAHGVPFVASDLGFFREFSALGLGITAKREPGDFSNAIKRLDRDYDDYVKRVAEFKQKLSWDSVARQHQSVYTATAAAAAA
jgi:glycosyltransferase involved in cell wall biosynthesis